MKQNDYVYDLLWTMRELLVRRKGQPVDEFADAVGRYTLVQFGVLVSTIDEANNTFFQRLESNNLGNYLDALKRIQNEAGDNDFVKEFIISSLAAVAVSQYGEATQEQRDFIQSFQSLFDMKPSQYQNALQQGMNWAMGLHHLARVYAGSGRFHKEE